MLRICSRIHEKLNVFDSEVFDRDSSLICCPSLIRLGVSPVLIGSFPTRFGAMLAPTTGSLLSPPLGICEGPTLVLGNIDGAILTEGAGFDEG